MLPIFILSVLSVFFREEQMKKRNVLRIPYSWINVWYGASVYSSTTFITFLVYTTNFIFTMGFYIQEPLYHVLLCG